MTNVFTARLASALGTGALAVVLFACGDVKSASDIGSAAEDFTATDVNGGGTFHLSDHIGKQVVLIDFWATWCAPCLAEMPHLEAMQDKYKKNGLLVVAVSMDGPESISDVPAFAKRNNMNFPVLLDEDSSIASIYNPRKSAPLSAIIDKGGRITAVREGYNPGDEAFVEKDVQKALGLDAQAPPPAASSAAPATPATSVPPPPADSAAPAK